VFFLLAYHLGWGMRGIWWGIFLITWTAAVIAILYVRELVIRMLREDDGEYGPSDSAQ